MADLIQKVSDSTRRTMPNKTESLEDAAAQAPQTNYPQEKRQKPKSNRILPWFMQDNDDDFDE